MGETAAAGVGTTGAAPGTGTASAAGENRFGRASELRLRAAARDGQTTLPELYASMPFKVMHPLPVDACELPGLAGPDGTAALARPAQVMVMAVSAGIMAGDDQRIEVAVDTGAALQVTTQAFEKIHRMDDGAFATRRTRLTVAPAAYLDYRPLPQIPFADSAFSSVTEVDLADRTSCLVYGEILSCGRVARGERFAYRSYRNRVNVTCAGEPVFVDNTVYEPGLDGADLAGLGFYEGFTHLANLVLMNVPVSEERFAQIRSYLLDTCGVIGAAALADAPDDPDDVIGGITRLESGGCLVKLLGRRAQRLQDVLDRVRGLAAQG